MRQSRVLAMVSFCVEIQFELSKERAFFPNPRKCRDTDRREMTSSSRDEECQKAFRKHVICSCHFSTKMVRIGVSLAPFVVGAAALTPDTMSFYSLSATRGDGSTQVMEDCRGKVVYATNVASK